MTNSIRLRVRGPQGLATITIGNTASWQELLKQISEKTDVYGDFDLKYGYPPQPFNTESIDGATLLSDLPHNLNGEQLIVMPRDIQAKLSNPTESSKPRPEVVKSLPPQNLTSPPQHKAGDFPDQPLGLTRKPKGDVESEPPEIPVPMLEGVMVLRVMYVYPAQNDSFVRDKT